MYGLTELTSRQNIIVVAYSPLGNNSSNLPKAVHHPEVLAIARKLRREPAQVLISWAVQRGTAVLPKSVTPQRILDNFHGQTSPSLVAHDSKLTGIDFILPKCCFERLNKLDKHRRYNFPARLGVDIFGEVSQESLRKSVDEWKASQRLIKA